MQGISLCKGFPLIEDFPLQGISPYKGFPFARDFPLWGISLWGLLARAGGRGLQLASALDANAEPLRPIRIARIRCPRFVPRVGLPRNLCSIGSLTAALRFSKGWVQKDANLGLRTGCTPNLPTQIVDFRGFDSSIILILRGGIPRPKGNFPESLSQAMSVGVMFVGRSGVAFLTGRP